MYSSIALRGGGGEVLKRVAIIAAKHVATTAVKEAARRAAKYLLDKAKKRPRHRRRARR